MGCSDSPGTLAIVPLAAPDFTYFVAGRGALLAPGTLGGKVALFDGKAFVPAANTHVTVTATATGSTSTAVTDALGTYAFANVPAGVVALTVEATGYHTGRLACRLSPAMGLSRANLALVPTHPPSDDEGGAVWVAGLVTDPRGSALPGATVRCVDSASGGGQGANQMIVADADGFYICRLPGIDPGPLTNAQALLTAFGRTPGDVHVETSSVLTLPLNDASTYAVTVATTAFTAPRDLAWLPSPGPGRRSLRATGLPQRKDELVVRFSGPAGICERVADELSGEKLTVAVPLGWDVPGTTLELLALGLVAAESAPPALPL